MKGDTPYSFISTKCNLWGEISIPLLVRRSCLKSMKDECSSRRERRLLTVLPFFVSQKGSLLNLPSFLTRVSPSLGFLQVELSLLRLLIISLLLRELSSTLAWHGENVIKKNCRKGAWWIFFFCVTFHPLVPFRNKSASPLTWVTVNFFFLSAQFN